LFWVFLSALCSVHVVVHDARVAMARMIVAVGSGLGVRVYAIVAPVRNPDRKVVLGMRLPRIVV